MTEDRVMEKFRACHEYWLGRVDKQDIDIKDIEHFRIDKSLVPLPNYVRAANVAVLVDQQGFCYMGVAQCSMQDQYNHKVGYRASVGRALKKAAVDVHPDFYVDEVLVGKNLFLVVRATAIDILRERFAAERFAKEYHGL